MKNWKVLFVKPRAEKKVTEYCRLYGIPFYLPLRERQRIVQRRKIRVRVPIFPGYVFACFPDAQRMPLLQTNLLVRILVPVNARPAGENGSAGNQISMLPLSVPLGIEDPLERIQAVMRRARGWRLCQRTTRWITSWRRGACMILPHCSQAGLVASADQGPAHPPVRALGARRPKPTCPRSWARRRPRA